MYLFNNSEECEVERVSEVEISSTLRGYNLNPRFELLSGLSVSEVADLYCNTMRRIYLKKNGVDFGVSVPMIRGGAVHSLIEKIFKLLIEDDFEASEDLIKLIEQLKSDDWLQEIIWSGGKLQQLFEIAGNETEYQNSIDQIKKKLIAIIEMELKRIESINSYSNKVQLLDLEKYVDGSIFHLGNGRIDLILGYKNSIGVCDLKSSYSYGDNLSAKFQIALYSMMMECEHKVDVNWGVIVFPYERVNRNNYLMKHPKKIIIPINDTLRENTLDFLRNVVRILGNDEIPRICNKFCLSKELCQEGLK